MELLHTPLLDQVSSTAHGTALLIGAVANHLTGIGLIDKAKLSLPNLSPSAAVILLVFSMPSTSVLSMPAFRPPCLQWPSCASVSLYQVPPVSPVCSCASPCLHVCPMNPCVPSASLYLKDCPCVSKSSLYTTISQSLLLCLQVSHVCDCVSNVPLCFQVSSKSSCILMCPLCPCVCKCAPVPTVHP